jgi:hypothetical protein
MKIENSDFGYRFNGKVFEFFLDEKDYPEIVEYEDIFVTGSFNDWRKSADPAWKLTKKIVKGKCVFVLPKSVDSVSVPGNSGYPEFKFFVLGKDNIIYIPFSDKSYNRFGFNKVILFDDDDIKSFAGLKQLSFCQKNLDEFDLECPACRAELSNIRLVPGTRSLFRGYHPFKKSFNSSDLEEMRFKYVEKAFSLYGFRSCISLSGHEVSSGLQGEETPAYLDEIKKNGNVLWTSMDYELIYYHSDSALFSNLLHSVCSFIISHPGPFYIHCRVGGDRTGVFSAVLAALCGATWKDIARDFYKTVLSGIGDYRDEKLLRYSIRKMIRYDPAFAKDLAHLMQSYFIKEKILSSSEIGQLIEKLTAVPKKKETDFFNFQDMHICAKRSAKI